MDGLKPPSITCQRDEKPDQDLKRHRPEANLRSVSAAEKPGVLKGGYRLGLFVGAEMLENYPLVMTYIAIENGHL
jgi:hypothetical protein